MKIRLIKPYVGKEELEVLKRVIYSRWLGRGPLCTEFEEKWNKFLGVKASTAVNSGTAALHLALLTFGFPKGKKVLIPAMTFCSTANASIYCGLEPVFVDVDETTLSMDIDDMKKKYTKDCVAIMPVHFGGHPAKMDEIIPWSHGKGMKVISDCAHVAGGVYKGKKLGTWADISCFSFQEKKLLCTGDGGMISSNNPELIEPLRSIKEVGMTSDTYSRYKDEQQGKTQANPLHWKYDVTKLGYKYNMCDVIAAIGLAQLEKLDKMNKKRIDIVDRYLKGIKDCKNIKPAFPYDMSTPYYDFMVRLKDKNMRNKFIVQMQKKGIATGVHTMPVPYLKYYRRFEADVPTAMKIWEQYVVLPLFVELTNKEVQYIIDSINKFDKQHI